MVRSWIARATDEVLEDALTDTLYDREPGNRLSDSERLLAREIRQELERREKNESR